MYAYNATPRHTFAHTLTPDPLIVRGYLPKNWSFPLHGGRWRDEVLTHFETVVMLSKKLLTTTKRAIGYILYRYRPDTRTAQLTQQELATFLSVSYSTARRILDRLERSGFLIKIREGRSVRFSRTPQNEAPIYTLAVPQHPAFETQNEHPLSTFKLRVKSFNSDREFSTSRREQSMKDKKITLFNLHTPTHSVKERIQATIRLKEEAVELRSINTLELTRRISAFYKAGWTISDVLYALENHPTSGAYTTYGAGGMRSVTAWLHMRLNAWKTGEGQIMPSREATRAGQAAKRRAQAIEAEKQILARRKRRHNTPANDAAGVGVWGAGLSRAAAMREYLRIKERFGAAEAEKKFPAVAALMG